MSIEAGTGRGSSRVRLVLDPVALHRLLQGENGPVVREMVRRTDLFLQAAKRQIRIGHVAGGSPEPGNTHGGVNLRDTGYKRISHDGKGNVQIIAGFNHPIALIHHEGTRPHIIVPRDQVNGILVFWSNGGVRFAKRVHHPGTHPNRYLTDNMRIITH